MYNYLIFKSFTYNWASADGAKLTLSAWTSQSGPCCRIDRYEFLSLNLKTTYT